MMLLLKELHTQSPIYGSGHAKLGQKCYMLGAIIKDIRGDRGTVAILRNLNHENPRWRHQFMPKEFFFRQN